MAWHGIVNISMQQQFGSTGTSLLHLGMQHLKQMNPKGMRNRNVHGHSLSPPSPIDPTVN